MSKTSKVLAAGAAGMVLAAGGAIPALAAPVRFQDASVGNVFSGTVEIASTDGLLVERHRRKGDPTLVSVDLDHDTVVSKGGVAVSVEDLAHGAQVIVSGTKTADGAVLASKIIIRS